MAYLSLFWIIDDACQPIIIPTPPFNRPEFYITLGKLTTGDFPHQVSP